MTTKSKIKYGAELAIHALDSKPTYWGAFVRLYEMDTESENRTRWESVRNSMVEMVQFSLTTTDWRPQEEWVYTLGLPTHGHWELDVRWEQTIKLYDADRASKLAAGFERKMQTLAVKFGEPGHPKDALKRAIAAINPVAMRIRMDYGNNTGREANQVWHDLRKSTADTVDYLLRREWTDFRTTLKTSRPDLFERKEVTA